MNGEDRAIAAIENPIAAILAASPDCIKILSADGTVRFMNDCGLALLEADSPEQLLGTYYPDLWPPSMRQIVADAIRGAVNGEPTQVEGFCPTLKGTPRWWETHFRRVKSSPTAATEVVGVTRDISTRRTRELLLATELAAVNRRTTEFIATLAHELRNPLAPIRTGLQLMRKAGDDAAAIGDVREMMERQVGQMAHLITDLLDIARVTSGKIELKKSRVELRQVIESALEASASLISSAHHSLSVSIPDESLYIDGDPLRLAQIFTNILNNAAKYTAPGGFISVSALRADPQVVIDIADSGIGIAPEALVPIFEMFTKVGGATESEQGGLGIGLNLVRRLAELHGGSVAATSEGLGRGSHFLVRLPLSPPTQGRLGLPEQPDLSQEAQRVRVLLVDDNVDAAASLSMLLELEAHTTRVANSGVEALQMVAEFVPDIVFLDIGMPGMNGYEVARAIRGMPEAGNPVLVALTGWGGESDRVRSKNAGFDEHLTKPADISAIEKLLASLNPHGR